MQAIIIYINLKFVNENKVTNYIMSESYKSAIMVITANTLIIYVYSVRNNLHFIIIKIYRNKSSKDNSWRRLLYIFSVQEIFLIY